MKRIISSSFDSYRLSKERAMALPVSLIVLLVAGMLVGVSMYLIENMASVTRMKSDDELRMNAALAGLEVGKRWIVHSINVDNHIPRRLNPDSLVTSADMAGAHTSTPQFAFLVARNRTNQFGNLTGSVEGVPYEFTVYDLGYDVAEGVTYTSDMPMSMFLPPGTDYLEGGSLVQRQSYASSNRGVGSGGIYETEMEYGFYVVRSTAVLNGIEKTIEQGVRMRE